MSSTEFRGYGQRGPGKWITVYAREGHTFAVIAGLRLDTTPFDHYTGKLGTSLVRGLPPTPRLRCKASDRVVNSL
jgi:hypothetical protein